MMCKTIKANEDNDKKFRTGIEDSNKKDKDKPIQESTNGEEKLEYFTE